MFVKIFLDMPFFVAIVIFNILEFGPWLVSTFISIILISGLVFPLFPENKTSEFEDEVDEAWDLIFISLFKIPVITYSIVITQLRAKLVKETQRVSQESSRVLKSQSIWISHRNLHPFRIASQGHPKNYLYDKNRISLFIHDVH